MATTRKKNEVETSEAPQVKQTTEVVETPAVEAVAEAVERTEVAVQPEVQPEAPVVPEETKVSAEPPLAIKYDNKPGVYRTTSGYIVERF